MFRKSLLNKSKVDWPDHVGGYPVLYNCNPYRGCVHNCSYCYAAKMPWTGKKVWSDVEVVENAVELAEKEINRLAPGRIMFSSMTDPYQRIEEKTMLSRRLLEVLLPSKQYVIIITKSDLVMRDFDLIGGYDNVEIRTTLTSLEKISHEKGAPGNQRRIKMLKTAYDMGIKTSVSLEPWIPNVTDPVEIISECGDFVDFWVIGTMNYSGVDMSWYHERLPAVLNVLKENGLRYFLKKELRF